MADTRIHRVMHWHVATLVLLATTMMGCASGRATMTGELSQPLTRVLVIVESDDSFDGLFGRVETMLLQKIQGRGLEAESFHVDELSLNPQESVAEKVRSFGADGVLIVNQTLGAFSSSSDRVELEALLLVPGEGEPLWRAEIKAGGMFPSTATGISDKLMDLLTEDGIL